MLSNAYFLAKFRFDTADNEPAKNLQNLLIFPILLALALLARRWSRGRLSDRGDRDGEPDDEGAHRHLRAVALDRERGLDDLNRRFKKRTSKFEYLNYRNIRQYNILRTVTHTF